MNGKETLLRGGCIHHDNGILRACAYKEAEERKVRIMKGTGFNAIRSSHNPCSKALLDACDRHGMYVMDESWDMWFRRKSKYDYAPSFKMHYKEDLKAMVEKDYNHPSVVFYSIGNEVSELLSAEGCLNLSIAPEKESVKKNEVFFVPINICGQNGVVECNADDKIQVNITGGELLGFGSANPRTEEDYLEGRFTSYAGRTLAVIRAGKPGEIEICAKGEKLGTAKAHVNCQK